MLFRGQWQGISGAILCPPGVSRKEVKAAFAALRSNERGFRRGFGVEIHDMSCYQPAALTVARRLWERLVTRHAEQYAKDHAEEIALEQARMDRIDADERREKEERCRLNEAKKQLRIARRLSNPNTRAQALADQAEVTPEALRRALAVLDHYPTGVYAQAKILLTT